MAPATWKVFSVKTWSRQVLGGRDAPRVPNTCERSARRRELDPSRPSEADGDFAAFDDHGDAALAGEADHPVEFLLVFLDVDVGEGNLSLRVVLTGRGRIGSGVFSEDLDALGGHDPLLPDLNRNTEMARKAGCYDFSAIR